VSHALYINGNVRAAAQTMSALMQFFARHRHRFEDVIDGRVKRADPMSPLTSALTV
jgi:phosphorylase kinase alpha/beta subunit